MYCMQADTSTVTEVSCDMPDSLVVMTRTELQQYSPFYLDIESAGAIGGALLLVMAVAFVLRAARKTLGSESE
ncbi:hypothetical protein CLU85_2732 [Acidovorax sp. 69]|nr:hypothetical protein CLU85_2732 [Acidovorax sp. 69]